LLEGLRDPIVSLCRKGGGEGKASIIGQRTRERQFALKGEPNGEVLTGCYAKMAPERSVGKKEWDL